MRKPTTKKAKIEFKLEEELFQNYKYLCSRKGYDMSKRLRLFIEHELKKDKDFSIVYANGEDLFYPDSDPGNFCLY